MTRDSNVNQVKKCRHGDMVFPPHDQYVGRSLAFYGEFSEDEVILFEQLVRPGDMVLDVGANIGAHTVPLAQRAGPEGLVLAFEPQRILYYHLCANVVLNGLANVVCHQAAVGESTGSIQVPELDYTRALNFGGIALSGNWGSQRCYTVPVLTVDGLALDRCRLIKIDVEGMEKQVLAGAVRTLEVFKPLLYVEDDRAEKSAELQQFLVSQGYELYLHTPPLFNPRNFARNAENLFPNIVSRNLFCHHRDITPPIDPAAFGMRKLTLQQPEAIVSAGEWNIALAWRYHQADDYPRAEQLARQILKGDPTNAAMWRLLGEACLLQDKRAEAEASLRESLRLSPDHAETLNNLGVALAKQRQSEKAIEYYERALQLRPEFADAHSNLGAALLDLGKLEEAVEHLQVALKLRPNYVPALTSVGNILVALQRLDEALATYAQVLQLKPDHAEAHMNRSLVWLQQGNFAQGLPEYEWRWAAHKGMMPAFRQPLWDGSPLEGRTILLHAEQGLGDTIQFIRYAVLVKQRGGRVVVQCQPDLVRILTGCAGVDLLVPRGQPLPDFEVQAPLLTLLRIFGTTPDTVPASIPYLFAEPPLEGQARARVAAIDGFKVGIVWQGSPGYAGDRARSFPLTQFAPLAAVPGVQLVSLQYGAGREQLANLAGRFPIIDLSSQHTASAAAFAETAAVMKNLDLVISCDSAPAHLAGALGVPVWLPLPFSPDWRWLSERADTPWYPTMQLFRQKERANWPPVFARMAETLRQQLAARRRAEPIFDEVSPGELLDRIVALRVQSERLNDSPELQEVERELEALSAAWAQAIGETAELEQLTAELRAVHETLRTAEDALRICERKDDFGPHFIQQARTLARQQERRLALRQQIDDRLGSTNAD